MKTDRLGWRERICFGLGGIVTGLGIRVVTGLAKNVNYMASMEMNNLIIEL